MGSSGSNAETALALSAVAAAESLNHQKYNLRWHDYPQSVVTSFRHLKEDEDFVDVTLACNSQQFTAHKVVLSACSPYFKNLLKTNPCQHPIVILRDITEDDLGCILKFMYHGEVQVAEEHLKDFLKTAETLQVKGLAEGSAIPVLADETGLGGNEVSEEERLMLRRRRLMRRRTNNDSNEDEAVDPTTESQKVPSSTSGLNLTTTSDGMAPNNTNPDNNNIENFGNSKRLRLDGGVESGSPLTPPSFKENNNKSGESLLSQALAEKPAMLNFMSNNGGGRSDGHDDSGASDTGSERPESMLDGSMKTESNQMPSFDLHRSLSSPAAAAAAAAAGLFPPGLEALYRQAGFPTAFLGLGGGAGAASVGSAAGSTTAGSTSASSTPHLTTSTNINSPYTNIGLQSHANNPSLGGKLDMMRVRATDPRPCPKCGKVYRSAHTLRTHMEDKHTVCPGYRCVLCGTVAKSRNSLHSHMSRQHRGISTKDLPVLPMPSPFDAELASKLLAKAGVKVSPNELAARASPTAPRRSDLPKLDSSLLHNMQQQQFPLPASMPPASVAAVAASMMHNNSSSNNDAYRQASGMMGQDPEDLRVPTSSPFLNRGAMGVPAGAPPGQNPMQPMGSALLDTYLSMIAAAGGDSASMAAALGSFPGRAAAFAAQAAAAQQMGGGGLGAMAGLGKLTDMKANGKDQDERSASEDREDEAIASDADISDTEDGPDSVGMPKPQTNDEDSIAAEDN